ncbi:MAG TPA: LacI family DNA-binding transcriptional regulator [Chloroflexia bacterium]|nr:LacI family DNA-binding transcriptional regulator [Chloroflexia bacterium]
MNLEEVARLAGVSRSTVSRVVNDDSRVSDMVRTRVQEIIREHDYHPNAAARSLASRRTRIIGLLIPQAASALFSDPFFPNLIQATVDACNSADYNLMMLMDSARESNATDRLHRRVIRGHHLDGLIIASNFVDDPFVKRLQDDRYPFVQVGRHPRYREISFVDVDSHGAARAAVTHLLDHGYRRIAIISGVRNMIAAIDRYGGYVSALQEAGLLPEPELAVHGDFTQEGGYRAMRALLPHRPDAVFAASDTMAIGALRAATEAGLLVPDDVAIIGFDNIPQSANTHPPLTTVTQSIADLGREAVSNLLDLIDHPDRGPVHRFLPTYLTIRRSCGCPEPADWSQQGGDA